MSTFLIGRSAYQIACAAKVMEKKSPAQAAFLKAFGDRGEAMTEAEQHAFALMTGLPVGTALPGGARTWLAIIGRQCGKTEVMTACSLVQVAFDPKLVGRPLPGQRFAIFVVGVVLPKTRKIMSAVRGLLDRLGAAFDEREGEISLRDVPVDIRAMPMSVAHASSDTAIGIFLEDFCLATSAEGSPRQDYAFHAAASPMLMQRDGYLVSLSQAHAKEGWQYENVEKHFRKPSNRTVAFRGATFEIAPWVTREECLARSGGDNRTFRRQYLGEPGNTAEALLPSDAIEACVKPGRKVLPPEPGVRYAAAADLGFRRDYSALSIWHREERRLPDGKARDVFVEDLIYVLKPQPVAAGKKRLDPEAVVADFSAKCRRYGVGKILIDIHQVDFAAASFHRHGVDADDINNTEAAQSRKAELFMAKIRAGELELLDDGEANLELEKIEFRLRQRGAISYAAPARRGLHDDMTDARFSAVEQLLRIAPSMVGAKCEISVTRSENGHLQINTHYYRETKVGGVVRRHAAPPPRDTPAFDRWAYDQLKRGVVSTEIEPWLEEKLGDRSPTYENVQAVIDEQPGGISIPVLDLF